MALGVGGSSVLNQRKADKPRSPHWGPRRAALALCVSLNRPESHCDETDRISAALTMVSIRLRPPQHAGAARRLILYTLNSTAVSRCTTVTHSSVMQTALQKEIKYYCVVFVLGNHYITFMAFSANTGRERKAALGERRHHLGAAEVGGGRREAGGRGTEA